MDAMSYLLIFYPGLPEFIVKWQVPSRRFSLMDLMIFSFTSANLTAEAGV
jgi:hypothetical protein